MGLIFLVGLGLVGYSLQKYGIVNFRKVLGSRSDTTPTEPVDTSKPLPVAATSDASCDNVRVRLNIWVGCVGGLVANGGLDTAAGSIYDRQGLKVSFKIIDDWTEGSAALASNNVDIMLTTADVWGKDFGTVPGQGRQRPRLLHGGLVARRRWRDRRAGHPQHRRPGRQDRGFRAVYAVAFPALERAEELRPLHRAAQRDLRQGRAHQGRHRARHAIRPAEGGRRRRLGSRI